MPTDFQKYQAGRALLAELDTLLDVDEKGYSRTLDANINDAKMVLQVALQEVSKRADYYEANKSTYRVVQETKGGRAGEQGPWVRAHGLTKAGAEAALAELKAKQPKATFKIVG